MLLTIEETASLLRSTPGTMYEWAERGKLPGLTKLGRRSLVRRDDLLKWLNRQRVRTPKKKA